MSIGTLELGTESLSGDPPAPFTSVDVLDAIIRALRDSGRLPTEMDYLNHEADDAADAAETFPAIELHEISDTEDETNSTLVRRLYDDTNSHVGNLHHFPHTLDVQMDIFTVAGNSEYNPSQLSGLVDRVLKRYDGRVRNDFFLDENGEEITQITDIRAGQGERRDGLTSNPALRRYIQRLTVDYRRELNTLEEYGAFATIEHVQYAGPDDYRGGTSEGVDIEYDPTVDE